MSTPIRIRRSAVPGKVPTVGDIQLGELAVNTYDGKAFLKRDAGGAESVVNIGGGYPGKTYFVTDEGLDTNDGESISSAFATLKHALSQTVSGDTVELSSGTFTEQFPLTIPQGVIVKGKGLRSTIIQPTAGTERNDAFLLNGETTVEDLTITNFYYNTSADTGYGFRFAPNMVTTTRSPYILRTTVLTRGSATSASDPYGFDTPDNYPTTKVAGRGALIDGSVVSSSTLEPAMLFNECTFITPNQTALKMTNGARSEWVNSFSYFASVSIDGVSGNVGLGSSANATLKLSGISTAISANQVIKYYQSGTPVAIGTVVSADGSYVTISGKGSGIFNAVGIGSTQDVRFFQSDGVTQVGTASTILWADYQKFGADLRAIGSASNFGTIGVRGDGPGVQLRLFGYNFGCVGSGKTFTQDPTLTIKSNEAVQLNGGRVYFQSVDQEGNFRVGNIFEISQETGAVSLASTSDITINGTATIQNLEVVGLSTFNNPVRINSNLNVTGVTTTGNLRVTGVSTLTGNTNITNNLNIGGITTTSTFRVTGISTLTGDVELSNALRVAGVSTFNSPVMVNSNLNVTGITTTGNFRVTGVSTFSGDVNLTNNLNISGITTTGNFRVTGVSTLTGDTNLTNNLNVSGITTTASFRVTGISTLTGDVNVENNLKVSGITTLGSFTFGNSAVGVITGPSQIIIDPAAIGNNTGSVRIAGDFYVDGTTTTVNSTTLEIGDITIGIGSTAIGNDTLASGGGIVLHGATDKSLTWILSTDSWTSSENFNISSGKVYKVNGSQRLSEQELTVPNAYITGLSTLGNLNVTGIGSIATLYVNTGYTTTSNVSNLNVNLGIVTHLNATDLNVTGVSTLANVKIGFGNTDLIVFGDARVTGILTVGTASITVNGITEEISVGNSTRIHTSGFDIGSSFLHSTGVELVNIKSSGIASANNLYVSGISTFIGNITANSIEVTGTGINTFSRAEIADLYVGVGSISTLRVNTGFTTTSTVTYENVTGILTATDVYVSSASSISVLRANIGIVTNFDVGVATATSLFVNSGIITESTTGIATIIYGNVTGILTATDVYVSSASSIATLRATVGYATYFTISDTFNSDGISYINDAQIVVGTASTLNITESSFGDFVGIGLTTLYFKSDYELISGISSINTLYVNTGYTTTSNITTLYVNSGITTHATITYGNVTDILTATDVNVSSAATIVNLNSTNLQSTSGNIVNLFSTNFEVRSTSTLIGITTGVEIGINTTHIGINTAGIQVGDEITSQSFPQNNLVIGFTTTAPVKIITSNVSTNSGISTDTVTVVRYSTIGIGTITNFYTNTGIATNFTAERFNVSGIATITDVQVSSAATIGKLVSPTVEIGIGTFGSFIGTSVYSTGIGTFNDLQVNSGIFTGATIGLATITNSNFTGILTATDVYVSSASSIATLTANVGIITNLTADTATITTSFLDKSIVNSGIFTEATIGLATITYGNVTGILTVTDLNLTGIATITNINVNTSTFDVGIVTSLIVKYLTVANTSTVIVSAASTLGVSTDRVGISTANVQVGDEIKSSAVAIVPSTLITQILTDQVVFSPSSSNVSETSTTITISRPDGVGIASISSLSFNSGIGTYLNVTDANIGVSTFTRIDSDDVYISGITTADTLYSNSGFVTAISGTDIEYIGFGTIAGLGVSDLYVQTGIITDISGTNIYYSGIGTIDQLSGSGIAYTTANIISIGASSLVITGISTLETIEVNSGIVTIISGTNIYYSGIGTVDTLYSNSGFVTFASGINLNYTGISTLTTVLGSGVTFTSADFTDTRTDSLYATGIGTVDTLYSTTGFVTTLSGTQYEYTNAYVTGVSSISTLYSNVGFVTFVLGENLNYTGVGTIGEVNILTDIYANSGFVTYISGSNLNYSGIGTIDSLYVNSGVITTLSGTRSTYVYVDSTDLYSSGIGSISTLNANVGLVTFVSGENLNYTGVGTISSLYGTDIHYSGIGTVDTLYTNVGFVTSLSGISIDYSGIGTIQNLFVNTGVVTTISGTNLTYSGIGIITQFKSYETETSGFTTTQSLHVGVGGSLFSIVTGIGSVGIGTTLAKEHLHVYGNILYSDELNTGTVRVAISTNGPTTIHEKFSRLEYRSVEYQIQASCSGVGNTGRYQFTKILSTHDGTTAFNVEYATVGTGTDVSSYEVDIDEGLDAGYIRLQATPAQIGITTFVISFTGFKL
jgi:hypothetical protein